MLAKREKHLEKAIIELTKMDNDNKEYSKQIEDNQLQITSLQS